MRGVHLKLAYNYANEGGVGRMESLHASEVSEPLQGTVGATITDHEAQMTPLTEKVTVDIYAVWLA